MNRRNLLIGAFAAAGFPSSGVLKFDTNAGAQTVTVREFTLKLEVIVDDQFTPQLKALQALWRKKEEELAVAFITGETKDV